MRQDPRAVLDERRTVFADLATSCDVLVRVAVRGDLEVLPCGRGLEHVLDRDEQIVPGRTGLAEPVGGRPEVEALEARLGHAVGGGRADRRRATHDHVFNRDRHVLEGLRVIHADVERQVPLIDELDDAALQPYRADVLRFAIQREAHSGPPRVDGARRGDSRDRAVRIPASSPS